ncbi:hypothetical protein GWO43_03045, partial [candidate division KSB1 bacterium]|nr:hypothetical protein [candidate division KSB1 bacterium]NIV71026.1 hypothetical protein [Phycisphaerae bacterium]NIS23025.1 hypothetical protein [candidate division KSB1 bacterium]NIT69883.1 hypothetical protein [candidate division KSB1 bacterium]NIU23532.1 hypothetical protein [candidate division KSB1 bacterium]
MASAAGLQMAFSHRPSLVSDRFNFEYFSVLYSITSRSGIGASFNYFDLGRQVVVTEDEFSTVKSFSYVAGISYAHQLTGGLSAGITLKSLLQ